MRRIFAFRALQYRAHQCVYCAPRDVNSRFSQVLKFSSLLFVCLFVCLVGWLVGFLVGWLTGWLVVWLVGWLVVWLGVFNIHSPQKLSQTDEGSLTYFRISRTYTRNHCTTNTVKINLLSDYILYLLAMTIL